MVSVVVDAHNSSGDHLDGAGRRVEGLRGEREEPGVLGGVALRAGIDVGGLNARLQVVPETGLEGVHGSVLGQRVALVVCRLDVVPLARFAAGGVVKLEAPGQDGGAGGAQQVAISVRRGGHARVGLAGLAGLAVHRDLAVGPCGRHRDARVALIGVQTQGVVESVAQRAHSLGAERAAVLQLLPARLLVGRQRKRVVAGLADEVRLVLLAVRDAAERNRALRAGFIQLVRAVRATHALSSAHHRAPRD